MSLWRQLKSSMVFNNKIDKRIISNIVYISSLIFVFIFFYRISSLTPLAGDDWGYAVNGSLGHPFKMAYDFYFNWSGRYFSELYGFIITPHKEIWNFLNAFLFTSIFYNILKISKSNKSIIGILLLLFLMFSVKDELRMETYTWLMGTTYVIPLALSLFFFNKIFSTIENNQEIKKSSIVLYSFILFYIGLTMENISLVMILANLCFIAYCYIKFKKIPTYLFFFVSASIISFMLLRLSPGASTRLIRDHQEWLNLSIFQQIIINFPNFINLTFIQHRYLVLIFSGLNILLLIKQTLQISRLKILYIILLLVFTLASFISISLTLSNYFSNPLILELIDHTSILNLIFWPIYIISIFINIFLIKKQDQIKVLFFILLSGLSNGVMMASPIFGYRSSLYTVYFMIVCCLIYLKSLNWKYFDFILFIPLTYMLVRSTSGLYAKYELVSTVHNIRLSEITFYQKNPDIKEAWLIRYPIFSIHSGDIEQDDPYHMEVFKEYYSLNKDLKIYFYYPENGYENLYSN